MIHCGTMKCVTCKIKDTASYSWNGTHRFKKKCDECQKEATKKAACLRQKKYREDPIFQKRINARMKLWRSKNKEYISAYNKGYALEYVRKKKPSVAKPRPTTCKFCGEKPKRWWGLGCYECTRANNYATHKAKLASDPVFKAKYHAKQRLNSKKRTLDGRGSISSKKYHKKVKEENGAQYKKVLSKQNKLRKHLLKNDKEYKARVNKQQLAWYRANKDRVIIRDTINKYGKFSNIVLINRLIKKEITDDKAKKRSSIHCDRIAKQIVEHLNRNTNKKSKAN